MPLFLHEYRPTPDPKDLIGRAKRWARKKYEGLWWSLAVFCILAIAVEAFRKAEAHKEGPPS